MDWKDQESFVVPPPNGYPALVASNAHINGINNGCNIGIYNKDPIQDDTSLCPSNEEILGTWECNDAHQDAIIPPEYTEDDIAAFLYSNSLQYVSEPAFTSIINGSNFSTHYIAWSSSMDSDTHSSFDVLASVDLNITEGDVKTVRTYHCTVAPNSTLMLFKIFLAKWAVPKALFSGPTPFKARSIMALCPTLRRMRSANCSAA